MVVSKDGVQAQRFLSVDVYQMSLVEPDSKRLGWGVVKFAGLLQVCFIPTPTLQTWHSNKQKKSTFWPHSCQDCELQLRGESQIVKLMHVTKESI